MIEEEKKPSPVTAGSVITNQKELDEWVIKSDRAIGYMQVYSKLNLHHYFDDKTKNTNKIWDVIKNDLAKPSILSSFVKFKSLVGFKFDNSKDMNMQI